MKCRAKPRNRGMSNILPLLFRQYLTDSAALLSLFLTATILWSVLSGNAFASQNLSFILHKSAQDLLINNPDIILVDTRNSAEFEKYRISGSINIPIYSLKTKAYLKEKDLILVDEGYTPCRMERECKSLVEKGFRVKYLRGGLKSWKESGGTIIGDALAISELGKISPVTLFSAMACSKKLILAMTGEDEIDPLFHTLKSIHISTNSERLFTIEFRNTIKKYADHEMLQVVIYNANGEDYDKYKRFEKIIRKSGIDNIYYLKGGSKTYLDFLERQSTMKEKKEIPVKTTGGCATCPR